MMMKTALEEAVARPRRCGCGGPRQVQRHGLRGVGGGGGGGENGGHLGLMELLKLLLLADHEGFGHSFDFRSCTVSSFSELEFYFKPSDD